MFIYLYKVVTLGVGGSSKWFHSMWSQESLCPFPLIRPHAWLLPGIHDNCGYSQWAWALLHHFSTQDFSQVPRGGQWGGWPLRGTLSRGDAVGTESGRAQNLFLGSFSSFDQHTNSMTQVAQKGPQRRCLLDATDWLDNWAHLPYMSEYVTL